MFQKDLLAPAVLNDPRYWSETLSEVVMVRPMEDLGNMLKINDEIVLIEPF